MGTATKHTPVIDSARCIEGVIRGTIILADTFGVTIAYADLDVGTGADWNPDTRTFRIRRGSPLDDSALLVSDLWRLLNIGIRATQARSVHRPHLHAVPTQRTG